MLVWICDIISEIEGIAAIRGAVITSCVYRLNRNLGGCVIFCPLKRQ